MPDNTNRPATKQDIDELLIHVDQIREQLLKEMRQMLDPVWRSCATAPLDDEPVTPEDEAAIEQGRKEIAEGRGIPHEEIMREFGL